jgi:hypothetical protein
MQQTAATSFNAAHVVLHTIHYLLLTFLFHNKLLYFTQTLHRYHTSATQSNDIMRFIVGMLMVASVLLCISAVTVPVKLHDNAEMYEERVSPSLQICCCSVLPFAMTSPNMLLQAITANKIADYFEKRAKDHCKICAGEVESCILVSLYYDACY